MQNGDRLSPEARAALDAARTHRPGEQVPRPESERRLPSWEQEALDRERGKPSDLVLDRLEALEARIGQLERRVWRGLGM